MKVERRSVKPAGPARLLGDLLGELGAQRLRASSIAELAHQLGREPEFAGAPPPFGHELLGRDAVVLRATRLERGDLCCGGARSAVSFELCIDLGAPAAERAQHGRRHTGDVGDPVANRRPLDAQLARELAPQPRLVEVTGGLGVGVDAPPVKRRPLPVGAEREIRDEHVGVQLRVASARSAMAERRRDEPIALDRLSAAGSAARHRRLALHVSHRVDHCAVVRVANDRTQPVVSDPEQHADALRRRVGQIEPRSAVAQHATERLAATRMLAGEHARKRVDGDRAGEPERCRAGADPDSRRLRAAEVVVLDTRAHRLGARDRPMSLLEVIGLLADAEFSDGQHDGSSAKPPGAPAGQRNRIVRHVL